MGEIDYKEIGDRIRVARIASNLTRRKAAERCGVTSSYYGNLERGDRRMSLDTLVRVSEGLDLSLDLLVYGKGKEGKDELSAMLSDDSSPVWRKTIGKILGSDPGVEWNCG